MIDIIKFFKSIYIYISSKLRFPNSSYENINDTIFDDNHDNENDTSFEMHDEEYTVIISNIHS
jgi:hypothetical protein